MPLIGKILHIYYVYISSWHNSTITTIISHRTDSSVVPVLRVDAYLLAFKGRATKM